MLRLLVALDLSDCSRLALAAALTVARHAPTELVVISVLERSSAHPEEAMGETEALVSELHKLVQSVLDEQHEGTLPDGARVHYTVVRGSPADEIIAQATAHRSDTVVIGTHGRTGLDRLLTGSVAERIVRHAPCSVFTVKPKRTA
jgi:nucleotide-binding universal stress UspA family protein